MIRLLQSSWVVPLVGGLLYLSTTFVLISPAKFEGVRAALIEQMHSPGSDPSWRFRNPEFDQLVEELKREKESLATREQQLQELQTRLESERHELTSVTQTVYQLQADFDQNVVRIKDQELENLKRQAKILAGMSPEGAAGLLNEMPDDDAVRILFTMKPDEASQVLDTLSKMGKIEAKRAAAMAERIRHALPPAPKPKPSS
jgi:flagellar motility protein MotE (MotC chaperone)